MQQEYDSFYVDTRDVTDADLSGINEMIHINYILSQAGKRLIFCYRKNSIVDKWVQITLLDTFVHTAVLPSN